MAEANWYKNAVVYGLDVARFYDADGNGIGDFAGASAKLDYLVELGITCIWLLPFYESPGRDNGYDVTNYFQVNRKFGTLEDFQNFMAAAKDRQLKVIVDLVAHHSSDEHPWFTAAIADPRSKYRDYYIWSKDRPADSPQDNNFPGEEGGVWHYEPHTKQYYHHEFYHFQPDLNMGNPDVRDEMYNVIDFWLALGVDGFRIDAATHFFEEKGSRGALDAARILKELRTFVSQRNEQAILLGEADVELKQVREYFGIGKRMHALLNFLLCNRLFLALAQQSALPLVAHLEECLQTPTAGIWVNFLRNLDELDLEQLSEENRQQVFAAFAPEPEMRIYGRGIRRRLAPMLGNDPQRIRMAYSLLFALPGTPLLVYGEEIGMEEDLALDGRTSVRTPMQWGEVAKQQARENSLLSFFRRLTALRKEWPVVGEGTYEPVNAYNASVFVLRYSDLVTIHNLSGQEQPFVLPEVTAATVLSGQDCTSQTIGPFGYSLLTTKEKTND